MVIDMSKGNLLFSVCLIVICFVVGITIVADTISEERAYASYISDADEWMGRGLYQRAIGSYTLAFDLKQSSELYEKINSAYILRYEEAPEETLDGYLDFLDGAVTLYPSNKVLVDSFINLFLSEGYFESVYECLKNAIANGYDTEELRDLLLSVRYLYVYRGSNFEGIVESEKGIYTVKDTEGWRLYSSEDGYLITSKYDYVSQLGENNIFIVTGTDSRIVDLDGMVLGIFKEKIVDSGIFADGLVPARFEESYAYYDEFADKVFGDYEYAGSFVDGIAAVKKDGKWMLIDTEGNSKSASFDDIVLDKMGRYITNDIVIAKSGSVYGIYNEDMELVKSLDCTAVDICTKDGIIAVCRGDKWGFVNKDGETVLDAVYDEAKSFSNGVAAVKSEGKWGFIDNKGNLVIEYNFSDVGYMNELGLCPVRIDLPEEKAENEAAAQPEEDDLALLFGTSSVPAAANGNKENNASSEASREIWTFLKLELGIKKD